MIEGLLSGKWRSEYTYYDGEDSSRHMVQFRQVRGKLEGKGSGRGGSKLILLVTPTLETRTLTGVWHERTAPEGPYRGRAFFGAVQLILDAAGMEATGKWVGHNSDATAINVGEWSLKFAKGFEAMDEERMREIATMGGRASSSIASRDT